MKQRILASALALALLVTPAVAAEGDLFPAVGSMPAFADVSPAGPGSGEAWYDYESVKVCVEAGLMKGTGEGFQPGGGLTIAELATVCARIHEKQGGMALREPTAGEDWYRPAIRVMDELGIDTGTDPLARATRDDFARMLSTVCAGDTLTAINTISSLPDTQSADALRLYNAGILTGTDDYGTFAGGGSLSRAEAAAMLARVVRPSLRRRFVPAERPAGGDDPAMLILGVSGDTTLLTVNGRAVPAKEYLYFLANGITQIGQYFGSAADINWDVTMYGIPLAQYLKEDARESVVRYYVAEDEAARANVTLTAEQTAELDGFHAYAVETLGGEEDYRAFLRSQCIDEAGLRHIQSVGRLYENLGPRLFPVPDQKELDAYLEEAGILRAKHILVSDEALGREILDELKAAGNSEKKFDELAELYSEDGRNSAGHLAVSDGYVFKPGEMIEEFEDGAKALAVGEISGLVEGEFGYHIILRLPVTADDELSIGGMSVREEWAAARMDALLQSKADSATVETTALYDALDVEALWLLLLGL